MSMARRFIRCLAGDLRYALCSPRFLAAVAGYTAVSYASLLDEMRMFPGASVCYLYMVYFYHPFWLMFLLFAAIPGSGSFCEELTCRYFRYRILRHGKTTYALSKAVSCCISAWLTVFLSQWLLIALLALRGPVYTSGDQNSMAGKFFLALANPDQILCYFMVQILILSAAAGFFCLLALWISTKIANLFVVLASPVILYYLIDNFTVALGLPFYCSLSKILRGMIEIRGSIGASLLYAVGIFTLLSLGAAAAFCFCCKRRCENE